MKKKFNKNDLLNLLIKKASGFHYEEEIYEYEKTQKKYKQSANYRDFNKNISFFDNSVMVQPSFNKLNDTLDISDGEQSQKEPLTLVKKKTSTHYIPPDMLAIKILLEIYGKEVDSNNVETMSDQDLINLKNQLIQELFNGDSKT